MDTARYAVKAQDPSKDDPSRHQIVTAQSRTSNSRRGLFRATERKPPGTIAPLRTSLLFGVMTIAWTVVGLIPRASADILVASGVAPSESSVLRFSEDGTSSNVFIAPGNGLSNPRGLAFGPDGNLYVSSSLTTSAVLRYNGQTGAFMGTFVPSGSGGLVNPEKLIFRGGILYVGIYGSAEFQPDGRVNRYNATTGAFMSTLVAPGSGGLVNVDDFVFGPDGNVYLANVNGANNVLRYDGNTGAFLGAFIPSGSGGLLNPGGVAFGPDGNLYVASANPNSPGPDPRCRVMRYNGVTGQFLGIFLEDDSLVTARQISFLADGNLYVSDKGSHRVLLYNGTTGQFIGVVASGNGLASPVYLTQTFFSIPSLATLGLIVLVVLLLVLGTFYGLRRHSPGEPSRTGALA